MKTDDFSLTTRDRVFLPGQFWLPANPRAFIAIVHGLGEHSARYARFAAVAVMRGFGVVAMDLRGHGRSPGIAAYVDHFSEYLLDVDALMAKTRELAGSRPIFLMGHSMGGAISVRWIAERQPAPDALRGLILSSALLKVGKDISKGVQLAAPIISQVAPHLRLTGIDPNSVSRDPIEVAAYKNDSLICHRPVPARTGSELLSAIAANHVATKVLTQSVYLFHGDSDTLTDPDGSRDMFREWGGEDKTLRIWKGSLHETLNDLDRDKVAAELLDWADARVGSTVKVNTKTAAKGSASKVGAGDTVKKAVPRRAAPKKVATKVENKSAA